MYKLAHIHAREQIRDRDHLRAAGNTVAAGSTLDKILAVQYINYLLHSLALLIVKGLEVLHVADIVLQLLYTAHSGQYAQHSVKACGKAYSIACDTASVKSV